MQYLLLIYADEAQRENFSAEDQAKIIEDYKLFTQDIVKTGHFKAGDALDSIATATTVRVRDGKSVTTDGPFAETKEQLGGYYVLECADLDEAIQIAARCPGAHHGTVELRPIIERGVAATQAIRQRFDAPRST